MGSTRDGGQAGRVGRQAGRVRGRQGGQAGGDIRQSWGWAGRLEDLRTRGQEG